MAEMDQGIKRLIQTHPADILALAVPDAEYLGPLPADLATEPQLMLDTLMRVRFEGVECAVDIEAEARPRREIARRLYEYGTRASIVMGLPILSVVLWLEPGGVLPPSPYELRAGSRLISTWHFVGIELYNLPSEALFTRGLVGLLPLVPFTREGRDFRTVERAAEGVKGQAEAGQIGELEALLAVFAARIFGDATMQALIRRLFMSTEILETSPLYQLWVKQGQEKGREQGLAEGRAEGRAEGVREAVLILLRSRFGDLGADLERAVGDAGVEALEAVLPRLATDGMAGIRVQFGLGEA